MASTLPGRTRRGQRAAANVDRGYELWTTAPRKIEFGAGCRAGVVSRSGIGVAGGPARAPAPHRAAVRGWSGGEGALFRQPQIGFVQLFDVDVLEGHDPDVLHESGG